ncbi:hypothetical protein CPB83DRAFT_903077 [Crepidotus variabilis]|uniref:Uncharacterized protein n=1 Tax=Crepidotus variabilis TaxID=179855 RepID=A0A9P6JTG1_9AGAR|nr:hypothetical protein CPB83DRAFT_903077 [Crepidotus variabilis]
MPSLDITPELLNVLKLLTSSPQGQALHAQGYNTTAAESKATSPSPSASPTSSTGNRTPNLIDEAFEKAEFMRDVLIDHNLLNGVGHTPEELSRIHTVDRSCKGAKFGEGVRFRSNIGNFCLNPIELPAFPSADPVAPSVAALPSATLAAAAEERVSPALAAAKARRRGC